MDLKLYKFSFCYVYKIIFINFSDFLFLFYKVIV